MLPTFDLLVRGGMLVDPALVGVRLMVRWFVFVDGAGNEVKASRRFRTRHVIRGGRKLSMAASATDQVEDGRR